jgi:hypothetical protein
MEASPELAVCEVCGRAVEWPTAGPHSRIATRSRGCCTSHAAVGFSSSMEGWRTSGAGRGYWRCFLPPDYRSECPNLPVLKRCIQ